MRIVTISRFVGSYADVIAATVARRMDLETYRPGSSSSDGANLRPGI